MEDIERLLDRARQGNSEALSVLYHRLLPGIFGYIATRMPDRATAEDLTSDVFLQMSRAFITSEQRMKQALPRGSCVLHA